MSKRGNGEGGIHKRPDGRWEARVTLGYVDGKRKRKSVYGSTQAEVVSKLTRVRRLQQQGVPLPDERLTVGQYLDEWLETRVRLHCRPATVAGYGNNIRVHLKPTLGSVPLVKLTPKQVALLVEGKLRGGLSPRTVQYMHAVLRAALNDAMAEDLVSRNAAEIAGGPSVPRKPVEPLSLDETRALLAGLAGDSHEALYVLAITSGLRQGELLALRWEDIDLESGVVRVTRAVQRVGEVKFAAPKTERSRRGVNVPPVAVELLKKHRTAQLRARMLAGSRWTENGLVFASSVGTPLDSRNVTQRLQATLGRLGIRRIRFHDLRHSYASLLLAAGESPRVVMELLGHSQISLTMNSHAHVMPTLKEDAAERLGRLLAGA